jgi:hypothetical protein
VNWQLSVPQEFVANALTVVVPTEKSVPGFFEYEIVGVGLPVAVAANVTTAPHWFASLLRLIFPGQVITGGVLTVTLATDEKAEEQTPLVTRAL